MIARYEVLCAFAARFDVDLNIARFSLFRSNIVKKLEINFKSSNNSINHSAPVSCKLEVLMLLAMIYR